MTSDWPISISEAARRIGFTQTHASILVESHKVPTTPLGRYNAKGLDRAGFKKLERLAVPFVKPAKEQEPATA